MNIDFTRESIDLILTLGLLPDDTEQDSDKQNSISEEQVSVLLSSTLNGISKFPKQFVQKLKQVVIKNNNLLKSLKSNSSALSSLLNNLISYNPAKLIESSDFEFLQSLPSDFKLLASHVNPNDRRRFLRFIKRENFLGLDYDVILKSLYKQLLSEPSIELKYLFLEIIDYSVKNNLYQKRLNHLKSLTKENQSIISIPLYLIYCYFIKYGFVQIFTDLISIYLMDLIDLRYFYDNYAEYLKFFYFISELHINHIVSLSSRVFSLFISLGESTALEFVKYLFSQLPLHLTNSNVKRFIYLLTADLINKLGRFCNGELCSQMEYIITLKDVDSEEYFLLLAEMIPTQPDFINVIFSERLNEHTFTSSAIKKKQLYCTNILTNGLSNVTLKQLECHCLDDINFIRLYFNSFIIQTIRNNVDDSLNLIRIILSTIKENGEVNEEISVIIKKLTSILSNYNLKSSFDSLYYSVYLLLSELGSANSNEFGIMKSILDLTVGGNEILALASMGDVDYGKFYSSISIPLCVPAKETSYRRDHYRKPVKLKKDAEVNGGYYDFLFEYSYQVNPDVLPLNLSGKNVDSTPLVLFSKLFESSGSHQYQEALLDHMLKVVKVYSSHYQRFCNVSGLSGTNENSQSVTLEISTKKKIESCFLNSLENSIWIINSIRIQEKRAASLCQDICLFGIGVKVDHIRFRACEIIGRLSKINNLKKYEKHFIDTIVSSTNNPELRAGSCLGLALLMKHNSSIYSSTLFNVIVDLSKDGNETVSKWALYSLHLLFTNNINSNNISEVYDDVIKLLVMFYFKPKPIYDPFFYKCIFGVIYGALGGFSGPDLGSKKARALWRILQVFEKKMRDEMIEFNVKLKPQEFSKHMFLNTNEYVFIAKSIYLFISFNNVYIGRKDSSIENEEIFRIFIGEFLDWFLMVLLDSKSDYSLKVEVLRCLKNLQSIGVKYKNKRVYLVQMTGYSNLIDVIMKSFDELYWHTGIENNEDTYFEDKEACHGIYICYDLLQELLAIEVEEGKFNRWIKVCRRVLNSSSRSYTMNQIASPAEESSSNAQGSQQNPKEEEEDNEVEIAKESDNEDNDNNFNEDEDSGEKDEKHSGDEEQVVNNEEGENVKKPGESLINSENSTSKSFASLNDLLKYVTSNHVYNWRSKVYSLSIIIAILNLLDCRNKKYDQHLNTKVVLQIQVFLKKKYNNNNALVEDDEDLPILLLLSEMIKVSFNTMNSTVVSAVTNEAMKLKGLELLASILKVFGPVRDFHFEESSILDQYSAQINAGLTLCYSQLENSFALPLIQASVVNTCALYTTCVPIDQVSSRVLKVMTSVLKKSVDKLNLDQNVMQFYPCCFLVIRTACIYAWGKFYEYFVTDQHSSNVVNDMITSNFDSLFLNSINILKEYSKFLASKKIKMEAVYQSQETHNDFKDLYLSYSSSMFSQSKEGDYEFFNPISNPFIDTTRKLLTPLYSCTVDVLSKSTAVLINNCETRQEVIKELNENNKLVFLLYGQSMEKLSMNLKGKQNYLSVIFSLFNSYMNGDSVLFESELFIEMLNVIEISIVESKDTGELDSVAQTIIEFYEKVLKHQGLKDLVEGKKFAWTKRMMFLLCSRLGLEVCKGPFPTERSVPNKTLLFRLNDLIFAFLLHIPTTEAQISWFNGTLLVIYKKMLLSSDKLATPESTSKLIQLSGILIDLISQKFSHLNLINDNFLNFLREISSIDSNSTVVKCCFLCFTVILNKSPVEIRKERMKGLIGDFEQNFKVQYLKADKNREISLIESLNTVMISVCNSGFGLSSNMIVFLLDNYNSFSTDTIPIISKSIVSMIKTCEKDRNLTIMLFFSVLMRRWLDCVDKKEMNAILGTFVEILGIEQGAELFKLFQRVLDKEWNGIRIRLEESLKNFIVNGPSKEDDEWASFKDDKKNYGKQDNGGWGDFQ